MRVVHLSDPHVIDWAGEPWTAFANKRVTGAANFMLRRRGVHRREVLDAMLEDVVRLAPDHVVVTGDVSSLAFARELRAFGEILERHGLDAGRVSVVPGNHDAYTRRAWLDRLALTELGRYASSDLHGGAPCFPFVRLRGPLAIIGLCSAAARPWFVCSGFLGPRQTRCLADLLRSPAVRERYPVVLLHHPPIAYPRWLKDVTAGLMDRRRFLETLGAGLEGRDALVLAGHLHARKRVRLDLPGRVELLVAPSASDRSDKPSRCAAFHVIHFEAGAGSRVEPSSVEVRCFDPQAGRVIDVVPEPEIAD